MIETGGWLFLERASAIITPVSLFGFAGVVYAWVRDAQRMDRRQRLAARLAAGHSTRPVALAISLADNCIDAGVQSYLEERYPGLEVAHVPPGGYDPAATHRFTLMGFEHGGTLTPDLAQADLERLRTVVHALKAEGYTEVHLFMQTTVAFGCAVGALFTNWGDVHVYHSTRSHPAYEHWFCLDEVKRAPPQRTLGAEAADQIVRLVHRVHPPAGDT